MPLADAVAALGDMEDYLAAGRLPSLTVKEERGQLPEITAGPLFTAWGSVAEWHPAAADLQLAEFALAAEEAPAESAPIAAACGACALESDSYGAAAELGKELVGLLERAGHPIPRRLYTAAAPGDRR